MALVQWEGNALFAGQHASMKRVPPVLQYDF